MSVFYFQNFQRFRWSLVIPNWSAISVSFCFAWLQLLKFTRDSFDIIDDTFKMSDIQPYHFRGLVIFQFPENYVTVTKCNL